MHRKLTFLSNEEDCNNNKKSEETSNTDEEHPENRTVRPETPRRGVLVHCREGLSRSPSVIIAFLVGWGYCKDNSLTKMKLQEAYDIVSRKG